VGSDDVPVDLQNDPELWSGCISGALREDRFLHAFSEAGFNPVHIHKREEKVWQHAGGIDFRPMTVEAIKPVGGKISNSENSQRATPANQSDIPMSSGDCCTPGSYRC